MTKRSRIGLQIVQLIFLAAVVNSGSAFAQAGGGQCRLNSADSKIKHVVEIIFDNVHLGRDNPNVPSDLEQMPNLLNFIQQKGTLDANHHPVLISHTADDELSFLTGVYGDRHGIPVANSYGVFRPDGTTAIAFSFFYWTNLVSDQAPDSGDSTYGMLSEAGKNAPAPWVPFTRAGCDFGTFSNANLVVETPSVDVPRIFGANSPEANESGDQQFLDFEGAAVHCAKGSRVCSAANHGAADVLPQEPGGYSGFNALYGLKYMSAALGGITDLDGNPLNAFPGFSPTASQSLGAVLAMQKAGIPITYAYITDLHDSQTSDTSFGPGEAGYVAQIKSYNDAFGKFFTQLKAAGIDENNTLFIVTADEGDHFVGAPPTNPGCDGVHTACNYDRTQNTFGSLDINLPGLVSAETGNNTPFDLHFDMAPTVYITGQPSPTAPVTRKLERDFAKLTALNPITNQNDHLAVALADPVEMGLLHMVTADPARTPSFTMFGAQDYWFVGFGANTPTADPTAAWNHGGIQPQIGRDWLGIVGPGVRKSSSGEQSDASSENGAGGGIEFSDQTDVRPTVLAMLGLHDDYSHDGRALLEALDPSALPESMQAHFDTLLNLGRVYKQINAPFGDLGLTSLKVSTVALASSSSGDATYTKLENKIAAWQTQRNSLADKMRAILDAAQNNQTISDSEAEELIQQGEALLNQVHACAAAGAKCAL
jgi:hypothetical protein